MDKEQIDAWNRAAVQDRDVEAALALGTTFVERRNARAREAAQAWFEYATMLDPSVDLLWRITEICAEADHLESARSWMHRAVTTEWAGCTYVVEPTVFPFYDVYDDGNVHGQAFAVQVSATPTEAARVALEAASPRFMCVNEKGEETDGQRSDEQYTPNWVSDIGEDVDGVWLSLDCKDDILPRMARTDIRILVEELGNAGAVSGHIRMPSDQLLGWERTTES